MFSPDPPTSSSGPGTETRHVTPTTSHATSRFPSSPTTDTAPSSRSCSNCSQRKIRCDKNLPCSHCTRAQRPCSYPAPGPRVRRSKKTIMAEMASRLSTLERSLASARRGPNTTSSPKTPTNVSAATPHSTMNVSNTSPSDAKQYILVDRNSSSQFFDEVLVSQVIGEEREVESALSSMHSGTPVSSTSLTSPFNPFGLLSVASTSNLPHTYHPLKGLAVRLWNNYLQTVEGSPGLKLLHLPTDQVKVFSVIDNPAAAPFDNLALSFAIYFASTVALDDSEADVVLGKTKDMMLSDLKVGFEQALAHGDFLDRPTLTGLYALIIYLFTLRIRNRGKAMWVLDGLVIRIAQALGLHRDGARLGLSPFQAEIRRRLWWILISRDIRAGEDYGLTSLTGLPQADVRRPLNVEDTELYPEMTTLPPERPGWTGMTFSLVAIELGEVIRKLAATAAATFSTSSSLSTSSSSPSPEQVRCQIFDQTRAHIEGWLQHCNPIIPQQRLALMCSRFILRKVDFASRLQWSWLQHGCVSVGGGGGADRTQHRRADLATEENLNEALDLIEDRLVEGDDEVLRQYLWAIKAYPQYYVTMYVLWYLCVKPQGPGIERAWAVVNAIFETNFGDGSLTIGTAAKVTVLTALRAKALSLRVNAQEPVEQLGDLPMMGAEGVGNEAQGLTVDVFDQEGLYQYLLRDMAMDYMPDSMPSGSPLTE